MDVKRLLEACSGGLMPEVKCTIPIRGATSTIGQVVVIKCATSVTGFKGCAVQFPGLTYDTWFSEVAGTDKRSHYMDELEFLF